jgi:hypothetical protein
LRKEQQHDEEWWNWKGVKLPNDLMRLIVDLAVSVICNYLNVVRVQHMQRYNETEREREREREVRV